MSKAGLKSSFIAVLPVTVNADYEWELIAGKYGNDARHYHTLIHLEDMYTALQGYYGYDLPVATILALVYHDFEYNVLRTDNEHRSALFAASRLGEWGMPAELIERVKYMIESTKSHTSVVGDTELNVFLDADMAILGCNAESYLAYTAAVRKEFTIYPDFMYNKGRRDFLKRTLAAPAVFCTDFFAAKYEQQARLNIQNELKSLL